MSRISLFLVFLCDSLLGFSQVLTREAEQSKEFVTLSKTEYGLLIKFLESL